MQLSIGTQLLLSQRLLLLTCLEVGACALKEHPETAHWEERAPSSWQSAEASLWPEEEDPWAEEGMLRTLETSGDPWVPHPAPPPPPPSPVRVELTSELRQAISRRREQARYRRAVRQAVPAGGFVFSAAVAPPPPQTVGGDQ
eukprot:7543068-Pyramimonas_sp.AAC.1